MSLPSPTGSPVGGTAQSRSAAPPAETRRAIRRHSVPSRCKGSIGNVSDRSPTLPDQSHCSPSHVPDLDPSVHVMAQLLPDRQEYGTDTKAWEPGRSPLPACVIHELCALADCRFRRPIAHAPGEKFDSAHNFVGDTYRKSGAFVAAAEELTTSKVVVDEWVVLVTPAWSRRFRSHCRAPARCGIVSNPVSYTHLTLPTICSV